jgi:hypothetical protein
MQLVFQLPDTTMIEDDGNTQSLCFGQFTNVDLMVVP